ncbi:hypothetical protein FB451DRAFT_184192 [Mycena latifolia]|nr:hypothetical protein FB451DRAFT_184192 [Mycena latifolia]
MHFTRNTFAVCFMLFAALAGAAPIPKRPELTVCRASAPQPVRREDVLGRLQVRGFTDEREAPEVAKIQRFARADGSNACIDGALDWILATAMGSNSSLPATATAPKLDAAVPSGRNSTSIDPPFVEECIQDVVQWAVAKLLAVLDNNSGASDPPGLSVSSLAPTPMIAPPTDSSVLSSMSEMLSPTASTIPSAASTADAAKPSAPRQTPTARLLTTDPRQIRTPQMTADPLPTT